MTPIDPTATLDLLVYLTWWFFLIGLGASLLLDAFGIRL